MADIDRLLDRFDLSTIDAAVARRRQRDNRNTAAIAAKRKKLEAELAKLDAGTASPRMASARKKQSSKGAKVRRPNARRLNKITLAEALHRVMTSRGKPTHYKDLADTVLKRGLYRTKSKNLLPTVMVTLTRDGRFKRTEPGMFALK